MNARLIDVVRQEHRRHLLRVLGVAVVCGSLAGVLGGISVVAFMWAVR